MSQYEKETTLIYDFSMILKDWIDKFLSVWGFSKKKAICTCIMPCESFDLHIDIGTKSVCYGEVRYQVRRQVVLVLEHLLRKPTHTILYTELNGILGTQGYFNGTVNSYQRVRTLKRDLRKALEGLPFDVVRPSADCLRLVRTDGRPFWKKGEIDNM